MAAQATDKGLQFDVKIPSSLPAAVRLDPTRTRQVLFNLLSNAIKFTERGSVGFEVEVQPGPNAEAIELLFTVRDTGIGMSAESVARLFERFFQVESRLNRRRGGSGLGLNISRALAELMGGSLQVASREGHGSSFTLRLPTTLEASSAPCFVDTSPPPPSAATLAQPGPDGPPREGALKVLVVDDHPINLKLATALLQKMGHEVVQAVNGRLALETVQAQAFDLVLMDLHMPEMDGLESTRHIRALPAPRGLVPVVALTANALEEARRDAEQAGVNGFLTKPLKVQELQAVVRNCQAAPHRRLEQANTTAAVPVA